MHTLRRDSRPRQRQSSQRCPWARRARRQGQRRRPPQSPSAPCKWAGQAGGGRPCCALRCAGLVSRPGSSCGHTACGAVQHAADAPQGGGRPPGGSGVARRHHTCACSRRLCGYRSSMLQAPMSGRSLLEGVAPQEELWEVRQAIARSERGIDLTHAPRGTEAELRHCRRWSAS